MPKIENDALCAMMAAEFSNRPLAIAESYLRAIPSATLLARGAALPIWANSREAVSVQRAADSSSRGPAVVGIYGPIFARVNFVTEFYGLPAADSLAAKIRDLASDSRVSEIVLDINSPGGSVFGLIELAAEIRAAREIKPVIAVANFVAASAAYWIASQASRVVVSPSGEVGSVGVYAMHVDYSQQLATDGVKVTFVSAGEFKTEGNPYEELGDEARAEIQRGVDLAYSQFLADVAIGRGVSVEKAKEDFGKGRMLGAADALAAGMVDEIAPIGAVLSRLGSAAEFKKRARAEIRRAEMRARLGLNF